MDRLGGAIGSKILSRFFKRFHSNADHLKSKLKTERDSEDDLRLIVMRIPAPVAGSCCKALGLRPRI